MERLLNFLEASRGLLHPMAIESYYLSTQLVNAVIMVVASIIVEIGTKHLFLISCQPKARPAISSQYFDTYCLTDNAGLAPRGTSFNPQDILMEQWRSDGTGRELHLSGNSRFLHIPVMFSCGMILVLAVIKCLNTKTILTHSLHQLKNIDGLSASEVVTLISTLAKMFVNNLNKHKRIVLMRSICEAVTVCVHAGFLIIITIIYGLPWHSPYPNGFDCAMLVKTTRDHHELTDRIVTHCSLGFHDAYSVAYTILWVWIVTNIILGILLCIFRCLIFSSVSTRTKYLSFQLGNNIFGHEELFDQLSRILSAHDFVILLHIKTKFGTKYGEKFTDFCKRVSEIIDGKEPEAS